MRALVSELREFLLGQALVAGMDLASFSSFVFSGKIEPHERV
jgi:hypothetical protein